MHALLFLLGFSGHSLASDFSLPFVNASDLGTVYSGWAAIAEDASTAFTNPAGLTRIHHVQLVLPVLGLFGDTKFTGNTRSPTFPFPLTVIESGTASSKLKALMPSFYFAAPLTNRLTFGFSQTNPFGLGTEYDKDSIVRYLSTKSKVVVIDVGPSLGFKVTPELSVGAGFDAQYLMFTLNHMFGPPFSIPLDSENKNDAAGWGYGWHGGVLYEFLPCARFGFNYLSRVWFHTKGDSVLYVPWLQAEYKSRLRTDAALPERAQASLFVDITSRLSFMSTLFYTHWSVFNKLKLKNAVFFEGLTSDVEIPFGYRDTFDYSAGMSYKATDRWLLRTGFQIMGKPSVVRYRAVADPIGAAIVVGLGARYYQNCHLSYDIGYGHSFFKQETVNLVTPLASAFGYTNTQSNVLGVQINWNIN